MRKDDATGELAGRLQMGFSARAGASGRSRAPRADRRQDMRLRRRASFDVPPRWRWSPLPRRLRPPRNIFRRANHRPAAGAGLRRPEASAKAAARQGEAFRHPSAPDAPKGHYQGRTFIPDEADAFE